MQRVDNLNQQAIFHGWEISCWNTMTLNSYFASFSCLSENLKMAQTAGRIYKISEKNQKCHVLITIYLFIYFYFKILKNDF